MDILKILTESAESLIEEDLDFFITELETGDYSSDYIERCTKQISVLRSWQKQNIGIGKTKEDSDKFGVPEGLLVDTYKLSPEYKNESLQITPVEKMRTDLKRMRVQSNYKSAFKEYVKNSTLIDSDFVDTNYGLFAAWEINAIISVKQMGEAFLEKYFGALDLDKIARYQLFSEGFFMKHFAQLNTELVLEKGKNNWRKKENRSKQLDVFLRLKGVKI